MRQQTPTKTATTSNKNYVGVTMTGLTAQDKKKLDKLVKASNSTRSSVITNLVRTALKSV